MTAWSGKRTAFENYSVYAMFPDLAVYNSRNTILLYGTLIYMGIWLCFAWLRAQQSRPRTGEEQRAGADYQRHQRNLLLHVPC